MLRTAGMILAVAFAVAAAAQDSDAARTRQRVEDYLGAIDRPVPAQAWQALGPDAVPILEEALQSDPIASRRAAAAAGLAAIGGDRAVQTLVQAARSESERWTVRSAAVRSLGIAVAPERLTETLRPILEGAASTQVRAAAAEVLSRRAPAAGCAAIRSQLAREGAGNQAAFSRAARRCR